MRQRNFVSQITPSYRKNFAFSIYSNGSVCVLEELGKSGTEFYFAIPKKTIYSIWRPTTTEPSSENWKSLRRIKKHIIQKMSYTKLYINIYTLTKEAVSLKI